MSNSAVRADLIALHQFDDSPDEVANNNSTTLVGGPTYVEGKYGQAISFDGTDDGLYVSDTQLLRDTFGVTGSEGLNAVWSVDL